MTTDIATLWNTARGDWSLAGDALASGNDIVTSVLISLFTDRVANRDDVIPDGTRRSKDPRGWWADAGRKPIGSRLWLIERAKKTQQTLSLAQGYIVEALQWLLDDGVASRVEVKVEWTRVNTLGAQVVVYSPRTGAPLIKLDAQNVFRLPDAQAWGWNTEQGTGQWVELATAPVAAPEPPPPFEQIVNLDAVANAGASGAVGITVSGLDPTRIYSLTLPPGLTYVALSEEPGTGYYTPFKITNAEAVTTTHGGTTHYSTAELARAAFVPESITGSTAYTFWIADVITVDNTGGLSIRIAS